MRIVSEVEFSASIRTALSPLTDVGCVTGPGRSGAIAAVYASHILRVPFIPYGSKAPTHLGRLLIIDTATESGATLRKAANKYKSDTPLVLAVYHEPPRVAFWYEAAKPQHFKHEAHFNDQAHHPQHAPAHATGMDREQDRGPAQRPVVRLPV